MERDLVHTKFVNRFVIIFIGFVVGSILGSFAKALADRSLINKSFWGRSYCPKCKHILKTYDLFPIFSYLFLKGQCRYCHKRIESSYPLIEISVGILVALLFSLNLSNFPGLEDLWLLILFITDLTFKAFFVSILIVVFITDIKKYFIPDRIVIPSIIIAFFWLLILSLVRIFYLYTYLSQTEIGRLLLQPSNGYFINHVISILEILAGNLIASVLIGIFFLVLILVTRGKGMGGGDLKLGAFIGLCLGFPNGFLAIMLGFLIGAISSVTLIVIGKKGFKEIIPFGPFLVIGSLITLFWGNPIINWYLNFN